MPFEESAMHNFEERIRYSLSIGAQDRVNSSESFDKVASAIYKEIVRMRESRIAFVNVRENRP
jgi:hypothetical protein